MAYETIEVEPLGPVIGAEIRGLDLSRPLGNQTFQEIQEALLRHLVTFSATKISISISRRHSAVTSASCTSTRPHHPLQAIRRF